MLTGVSVWPMTRRSALAIYLEAWRQTCATGLDSRRLPVGRALQARVIAVGQRQLPHFF